jgi:transcriptional regulator with XRE-family HTH domain
MIKEENLSQKIREIRVERNLSQSRFGKKIGKSGKTISAYESGRCTPTFKVLDSISQVYDVTFLHLKRSKREQLKDKINFLKDTIKDIETTFLFDSEEKDT